MNWLSNHPMLTRIAHELLSTLGKGVAKCSASAMGFPLHGETIAGEGGGTAGFDNLVVGWLTNDETIDRLVGYQETWRTSF